MANKPKITKEDLKTPDAFLTLADRVGQWVAERAKPIAVTLGLVIVLGVGYTAFNMIQRSQEQAASQALFQFEKKIEDVKLAQAKKQRDLIEKLSEGDQKDEEKLKKAMDSVAPLDFEKDFAANAQNWAQAIEQYKNTQSAQLARLRLAKLYLDYEKRDLAEPVLRAAIAEATKGSSTYGLSRTMLASVLSHQGKIDEAKNILQEVIDEPTLNYLHSEALLKLGILNQESGDVKMAEESFRRVTTEFADSEAGAAAKLYLRMIQFIKPKVETENKATTSVDP